MYAPRYRGALIFKPLPAMNHWTIGKRILAISALLIGLIVAVGIVSFVSLAAIRRNTVDISTNFVPGLISGGASNSNTAENFSNVLLAALATTPEEVATYRRRIKELSAVHADILA